MPHWDALRISLRHHPDRKSSREEAQQKKGYTMSKSIEEIVDIRCKLYEAQHMQEVRERQARERVENKTDVTQKPAQTPPANTNTSKPVTFSIKKG